MMRIRKRWRYIGWGCLAAAAFFFGLVLVEIVARW